MTKRIVLLICVAVVAAGSFAAAALTVAPDPADSAAASVRLEVRYDDGSGNSKAGNLTCRGSRARATGFLRKRGARRLCRVARELRAFLASPPQHEMCTEVWGGPDRARVRGRIGGDTFDRRLARNDGCEISDWDRAQPLLPEPKGAQAP